MEENRFIFDLDNYAVLKTPAMVGPRDEITYHDPLVTEEISKVFGYLLPLPVRDYGNVFFFCDDGSGNDLCILAKPVDNIDEIPKTELGKLMGAWFSVRLAAEQQGVDTRVRAIFRNFRLPNPDKELHQYRISIDGAGIQRLHVSWGLENSKEKNSSIDAARAFAKLLDCTVEDIDEKWRQFHVENRRQIMLPGATTTSPVTIDPSTGAVRVKSKTGAFLVDPVTGRVVTQAQSDELEFATPHQQGIMDRFMSLPLPAIVGIIFGVGLLTLLFVYLLLMS